MIGGDLAQNQRVQIDVIIATERGTAIGDVRGHVPLGPTAGTRDQETRNHHNLKYLRWALIRINIIN